MRALLALAALLVSTSALGEEMFDASAVLDAARGGAATMPAAAGRALPAPPVKNPWRSVRTPAAGAPASIGSHSAGCLRGAEELPLGGPGYEVMRPSRRRYFGHPRLLSYLRGLAADASAAGLGTLLVGDLGQPRGGPTLSGHASHQTGLDVDVWYKRLAAGATLTDRERETLSSPSLVVPDFERLTPAFEPGVIEALRLAAGRGEVERIFVNPVIKREACARYRGAAWLGKLRPWWGHDDHFHVRLACAAADALCRSAGDAVPPGDGCDATLDTWFTPESKAEARRQRTEPGKPPVMPSLPPQCKAVLAAP